MSGSASMLAGQVIDFIMRSWSVGTRYFICRLHQCKAPHGAGLYRITTQKVASGRRCVRRVPAHTCRRQGRVGMIFRDSTSVKLTALPRNRPHRPSYAHRNLIIVPRTLMCNQPVSARGIGIDSDKRIRRTESTKRVKGCNRFLKYAGRDTLLESNFDNVIKIPQIPLRRSLYIDWRRAITNPNKPTPKMASEPGSGTVGVARKP